MSWAGDGFVSVNEGEDAVNNYDRETLRKWVLWARLAQASFVEIAGKGALGRRGEGDLARVACGMK